MPNKLPSILIGTAVYVLLSLLSGVLNSLGAPMNYVAGVLSCVAVLGGAMAGVWHYTTTHALTLSAGKGAVLGLSVGVLGALIGGALSLALIAAGIFPDPVEIAVAQARDMGQTEDQVEMTRSITEGMAGPMGLVVGLVFGAVLGAAGGAIGAALFKRGETDHV